MPKLSVIVPFYGVEDYLAECLDSILAQTFADFEVILVDDGSLDGSIDIARAYEARDDRIILVRQENQGLGPARNTGVRHATGEYLMFIDSDDVLPERAFALLVGTLEETGSDFAVGNAWRFTRERGIWPSWTHRVPCARTRLRTNVREFPALIRDRMAWNKVYRRSFWDAGGYEFPAIRYEDYPVTLKAHLDAQSVDVLSNRIYLWRDRESGESITQQLFKPRNALERAASANLVLDLVAADDVPAQVRADVHAYFIDIDLVALVGALAHAQGADRAQLEATVYALARRLDPQPVGRVQRLARLVHQALRDGDFELARSYGAWREDGDHKALAKQVLKRPLVAPFAARAVLPKRRLPSLAPHRPLEVRLTSGVEEAGRWVFNGDVKLRQKYYLYVKVTARLRAGKKIIPLLVEPARRWTSLKVRVVVEPEQVAQLGADEGVIEVICKRRPFTWTGGFMVPTPSELPPVLAVDDTWAVARVEGGVIKIARLYDPLVAEGRKLSEDQAELVLNADADLVIDRPNAEPSLHLPGGQRAILDAHEVAAGDPPDDPVTGTGVRRLRGDDGSPVYVSRFPGAVKAGNALVRVMPNARGQAEVRVIRGGELA